MVLAHPLQTGDLDRVLVRRAQAGDREAFAELMRTHGDAVRQLVRRFVRNSDDARDVEQDAWLRAATHLDSLRDQGRFRPWLKSIARNASLTFLSSRSQSARDTTFEECDAEAFEDPAAETPERYVLSRDSQRKVWEALGALSERDRTALFLREYQEQPYEEIAKRLGVSRNAAEVCVFRARERFRRIFLDVEERQAPCGFDAFRLSSMVDRDVPAEVRREVELHLASCEPCAERLTTMTAGQALYRNLGMFGFPIPGAMGLVGRITGLITRIAGLLGGGGGATGGVGMSTAATATATTATTASVAAVVGAGATASVITGVAAASAIVLGVVLSQAVIPSATQPLPATQIVAAGGHGSSGALTPVALSTSVAPEHAAPADDGSDVSGSPSSDEAPVAPASAGPPSSAPTALLLPSPHPAAVPPALATPEQASPSAEAEQDPPGNPLDETEPDGNHGNGNSGNANSGNGNGGNANSGNGNSGNGNSGNGNGGNANSGGAGNANASHANANGGSANANAGNANANAGNAHRANQGVARGNSKASPESNTPVAPGLVAAVVVDTPVPDGSAHAQAVSEDKTPPVEVPSHEAKESRGGLGAGPAPSQGSGANAVGLSLDIGGSGGRDSRSSGPGANDRRTGQRGK